MATGSANVGLSAVIVSYNSANVLPRCVARVRRYLAADEVIVVDNASADDSRSAARDLGCEVVCQPSNLGYASACNAGAMRARHEHLLFVNPDVFVEHADLPQLAAALRRRPLGLLAPRYLSGDRGASTRGYSRRRPWLSLVCGEALAPALPRELWRLPKRQVVFSPACWLTGALLFASRSEFLEIGGFDERFFLYYEDQELSNRYQAQGLPVRVTDAVSARHEAGGSSGAQRRERAIPRAASALSSVELVGILHGERRARAAWNMFWLSQALVYRMVTVFTRLTRSGRGVRKLEELRATRAGVRALLEHRGPHYTLAKRFRCRWSA